MEGEKNVDWMDDFCWEPHRKILTPKESGIPELRCFGLHTENHAGQPLYPHYHEGCIELVFMLKGFQLYEVKGDTYNLSGHDVFVTYPGELHSSASHPQSRSSFLWMQLDLSGDGTFLGLDELSGKFLKSQLISLPRVFGSDSKLEEGLTETFFYLYSKDPLQRMMGQQGLIYYLLRTISLSQKLSLRRTECIEQAIGYLYDHLYEPILLDDVAKHCALSLSQFKKRFQQETGSTPRSFINSLKIEEAKHLLCQGESITHVALNLGFNTPNYFSSIFKRYTGMTPSEYLHRQKEKHHS